MRTYSRLGLLAAIAAVLLLIGGAAGASPGTTTRVSVNSGGGQANDGSGVGFLPISFDGRYVAFGSGATNLVPNDTNNVGDVFVHDRHTGETTRVSVDSSGGEGNGVSSPGAISGDGRHVAFMSRATNLVAGDTNGVQDIFVHDRQTDKTTRVSVDSNGNQGNGDSRQPYLSGDGRYVTFDSLASNLVPGDTNDAFDIFVRDRDTDANGTFDEAGGVSTTRVSVDGSGDESNWHSFTPSISADGRYVAFESDASDLVPGDGNGTTDIFVHDRQTHETTQVSVDSNGVKGNRRSWFVDISADGRHVAFLSLASNLVVGDTNVCYPYTDPGECPDVFVHDLDTGITTRVSVSSSGNQADLGSGRRHSDASEADAECQIAEDDDGDGVVNDGCPPYGDPEGDDPGEESWCSDAIDNDGDGVFNDGCPAIGPRPAGPPVAEFPGPPSISANGRYVAFGSQATNLVPGDSNTCYIWDWAFWHFVPGSCPDAFLHDRDTDADGIFDEPGSVSTTRMSVDTQGSDGNKESGGPAVTPDGRYVAFESQASDLVDNDTGPFGDVFVRDRETESVAAPLGPGGTLGTDIEDDGATAWDPVDTRVTTPNPGLVSIEETPVAAPPPSGFQFLGQQVSISAPPATFNNPLVIVFRIDSSIVPPGGNQNTIQIFKGGLQVSACSGPPGVASPDPCVSNRALLSDGDVEITVLTSTASDWNVGAASAVGGIAELPDVAASGAQPLDAPPGGSGWSAGTYAALAAGGLAAAVLALAGGVWYARRRWLR